MNPKRLANPGLPDAMAYYNMYQDPAAKGLHPQYQQIPLPSALAQPAEKGLPTKDGKIPVIWSIEVSFPAPPSVTQLKRPAFKQSL
jgi:hypothetical protein